MRRVSLEVLDRRGAAVHTLEGTAAQRVPAPLTAAGVADGTGAHGSEKVDATDLPAPALGQCRGNRTCCWRRRGGHP